jgi:hypothetical protein
MLSASPRNSVSCSRLSAGGPGVDLAQDDTGVARGRHDQDSASSPARRARSSTCPTPKPWTVVASAPGVMLSDSSTSPMYRPCGSRLARAVVSVRVRAR